MNPTHSDINEHIYNEFLYLVFNYNNITPNELDQRALEIYKTLYTQIHLGFLEESSDLRRQSIRAALCFSSIALCSNYDSYLNYYLYGS